MTHSTPRPLPAPSIGRDVHYVSYGTPGGEYASVCRAAKITQVNGPIFSLATMSESDMWDVGLCVMNPEGLFFNSSVAQMEGDVHKGGTWHWPERVDSRAELNAAAEAADRQHAQDQTLEQLSRWVEAFNLLHDSVGIVVQDMKHTTPTEDLAYWIARLDGLRTQIQGPLS